jgi:NAD(P)-dependent dehydrogenase (short-subunit alcohol dehydrogenase family)
MSEKSENPVEHRMQVDLSGEVGIVTGAGSGIGRETAVRLFHDGASLLLADVDRKSVLKVVSELGGTEGSAGLSHDQTHSPGGKKRSGGISLKDRMHGIHADVRAEGDVKRMVGECLERFGKIDFLVSNAGIVGPYEFDETTAEEWDRVFSVNTRGGFLCARHVLPHMKVKRKGRIIFIASTNGGKPGGHVIAYRASKAALIMLARSLALHAASFGISVNAVCPGVTMTPLQRKLTESLLEKKGMSFDEYVADRVKSVPLGRFTEMRDVADIIEFLVSDNGGFITGQEIYVNGGEW